jgi:hypothetical protein
MTQLLSQMMKLPMAIVISSMEILIKTMQDVRKMADQGIDVVIGGVVQTLSGTLGSENTPMGQVLDGAVSDNGKTSHAISLKEERYMPDLDLGGDDLKVVSYSIVFDKPDEEQILESGEKRLVDYATDGASYAGLRIAAFLQAKASTAPPATDADRRYLKFIYEVEQRFPKKAPNYEKRKVELLDRLTTKIENSTTI